MITNTIRTTATTNGTLTLFPAIRDTIIWIAAFIVSGGLGYYFWGTWAAVPFFLIYGVLYGSSTDSRWHECGHRTAFKTQWMNDAVYQLACFTLSDATLGMRLTRIALCTLSDENPTRAEMRRRIPMVLLSVCALGLGFLWVALDEDSLTWHDLISRMYQRAY